MVTKKKRIEPSHIKVRLMHDREAAIPIIGSVLLNKDDINFFIIISASNTYWQIMKDEYERLMNILTEVK